MGIHNYWRVKNFGELGKLYNFVDRGLTYFPRRSRGKYATRGQQNCKVLDNETKVLKRLQFYFTKNKLWRVTAYFMFLLPPRPQKKTVQNFCTVQDFSWSKVVNESENLTLVDLSESTQAATLIPDPHIKFSRRRSRKNLPGNTGGITWIWRWL